MTALMPRERTRAGALRRVRLLPRQRPPLIVALCAAWLVLVVLFAIVPSLFAPADPSAISPTEGLLTPSGAHLLGTDSLGRDVLSRVISGSRTALMGPLIISTATMLLSTLGALLAGYLGGWVDGAVSRLVDVVYALPALVVTIVLVGIFGGGYWLAVAALVLFNTPSNLRVLRAAVIERRSLAYVEAAETLGVGRARIMLRHLLPNLEPLIVTCLFLGFTYAMTELAALSFLGLGVPPGSPDWGRMLAENRVDLLQNPWAAVAPGLALILTVLSGNLVGDWAYGRLERTRSAR